MSLLDFVLTALSWAALSVYLHTQFVNSGETKFLFLLRVWWALFFSSFSCYCLGVDFLVYHKHEFFEIEYLVFDVVSVFTTFFLLYGVFEK